MTGYDRGDHWCNTGYANLFAQWQDATVAGGYTSLFAKLPSGDMICHSGDGANCAWGSVTAGKNIKPLACGKPHAVLHGTTGYTDAAHWCVTSYFR